ncbi:hypothetical protein QNO07_03550 [Streptomyces sp. 549]|uniref:hypothetical protein n=1 Tax=Streptomyces sp. 549 TaxID=3049076 RepID=UPI0024C22D54|nr:hypothetical protein [Streptomyces sp. 549]MDK1472509.1 hypothetical protein [Streptomyces sp. 549]
MGIESEQLVFDYLSRVGDLAHSTPMTAAERARLVSDLRAGIQSERAAAEGGGESSAAVRKILKRMGRPEDVVAAAGGGGGSLPEQRDATAAGTAGAVGPSVPRSASGGAAPPHLAGLDELTSAESDPDWWRGAGSGPLPQGSGGEVSGFVGGIELPDMLKPPPGEKGPLPSPAPPPAMETAAAVPGPAAAKEVPTGRRRLVARLRGRAGQPGGGTRRAGGAVELIAALALVAGAALGSLVALGLGWVLTWWSPRLSRIEAKWALLGMPGLVVGVGLVWLWGRADGRWGDPIADGQLQEVLTGAYPWVLRGAAVASAVFLLWRARRPVA